jgi:tagatose 1,6-diphosphate aldolase
VGGETVGIIRLRLTNEIEFLNFYGHIGYFIKTKFRGNGYACKAFKMLFPLIRYHEIKPVIITCDPNNIGSIKTCKRVGATHIKTEIFKTSRSKLDGTRAVKKMIWHLNKQ